MSAFDKFLMVVLAIELLLSLPLAQQAVPTWPSTKVELDGKSFSPQIGMDDAAKFFRSYGYIAAHGGYNFFDLSDMVIFCQMTECQKIR